MKFKKILLTFGAFTSLVIPTVGLLSCGSKEVEVVGLDAKQSGFGTDLILDKQTYNNLYHKLNDSNVGIAVIANHKIYEDVVDCHKDETVIELLDDSKFKFKRFNNDSMGAFINSFSLKSDPDNYLHGTRTQKNYGDFYPMYYINHVFAQLGVSNYHLQGHEMLEISYDNK